MKRLKRTAQGFSPMTGVRTLWKIELRRSNIFIDNPPPNERQLRRSEIFIDNRSPNRHELRRSGISRSVGRPGICKPLMVRCDRSDVAPTELDTIFLCRLYKDFAPTELFLIKKNSLPTHKRIAQIFIKMSQEPANSQLLPLSDPFVESASR